MPDKAEAEDVASIEMSVSLDNCAEFTRSADSSSLLFCAEDPGDQSNHHLYLVDTSE